MVYDVLEDEAPGGPTAVVMSSQGKQKETKANDQ